MKGITRIWEVSTASCIAWLAVFMSYYQYTGQSASAAVVAVGVLTVGMTIALHTSSAQMCLTISASALTAASIALSLFFGIPTIAYGGFFIGIVFSFFVAIAAQEEDQFATHSILYFLPALPLGTGPVIGGIVLLFMAVSKKWHTRRVSFPLGARPA